MKITFYGAAQGVTGSKHLIETNGYKILLDCGLYQGKRQVAYELNKNLPFTAKDIDAVILSHAHADHCGLLPMLIKNGYQKNIYATPATADIARLIMLDSAKIQMTDYLHLQKNGLPESELLPPLYTIEEVETTCQHFKTKPYARDKAGWVELNEHCRFKFYDAGHILGSAVTVLQCEENGEIKNLAFTGDLGNHHVPILREPEEIKEPIETLITECTYGNRNHRPASEVDEFLIKVIKEAVQFKKRIIVPAFALGRTQELIYILHKLHDQGKIPSLPIFIDSPLGNGITEVFDKHSENFDQETWQDFLQKHESPFAFQKLQYIDTVDESKKLNDLPGPCMIIASSGMAEGGRILHHLEHSVSDPNAIIIITGYQAEYTLGRKLVEGISPVKIYNRYYDIKAKVMTINELSAHADQAGLLDYINKLSGLENTFIVHAEINQAQTFKEVLAKKFPKLKIIIPEVKQEFII